jgi:hypothetical protein
MSYNPHCGKTFEDIVESMLNQMGYNTKAHTTLHTRSTHLRAEILNAKQKLKLHVECKGHEVPLDLKDVEHFCHKVAMAREKSEVDLGLLVSNSGFSNEALSWVATNCSFVQLKSYKQLITFSARCKKLQRKFN